MSSTRNHHFVPQGYLRGFSTGKKRKEQVFVYDLVERRSFDTLVRNVGAIRDFNRIEADGHHPNTLEDAFGLFESDAAVALRRVAETRVFAGEDRDMILNLIALLAVRNPRKRKQYAEFESKIVRTMIQLMTSTPDTWTATIEQYKSSGAEVSDRVTYAGMKEFVDSNRYDISSHQNTHIKNEISTFDLVLQTLGDRKWQLYHSEFPNVEFITCDHPVRLLPVGDKPRAAFDSVGHGMKNTAVLFPIARRVAIIGTFEGEDGVKAVGRRAVANLNFHMVVGAERQIYATSDRFSFLSHGRLIGGDRLLDEMSRDEGTAV